MKRGGIAVRTMLIMAGIILFLFLLMQPLSILQFQHNIDILFPKGWVGVEQRNLLLIFQVIMLLVVIPVFALTFIFSWKYRASNPKGKYDPDLVDSHLAEFFWWGIPLVVTVILSVLTWVKTHELDPYRPLISDKKPITIQVTALQWKWLFIYPEENIATVNFIQFPKDTPVHFEITADAPMNSFWIPALGGQIYAMASMKTELNLIANELGEFRGSSANLSGAGFSGMTFIAKASTDEEYQKWVEEAKQSTKMLDLDTYDQLVLPSENNPSALYQLKDPSLFDYILMKYMHPHPPK